MCHQTQSEKIRYAFSSAVVVLLAATLVSTAYAQEEASTAEGAAGQQAAGATDLAKKTQNPVSDLISVPFENNFQWGAGFEDEFSYLLVIKPVYPMKLSEEWNLVHRVLAPVSYFPEPAPGIDDAFGLGDITYQAFFSPESTEPFVWGVGPQFQFPTATDDILGTDKWSVGPAAVALQLNGPWVYGALLTYMYSFAGDDARDDVRLGALQYFINYNLPSGWYLTTSPTNTLNFEADDDKWTIPLGGGAGKVVKFGPLPVNLSLQAYYNVERPPGAPEGTVRFQFSFLLPRGR
ncbi:transporter [Persicimonas caeni]|uniref:Transporter n=1 Tax=Persicimonas caeni TaxID=2292766 RepID=A0A4Y6PZU1_PERCE|nr:transporter [Persicimonas caeni]QDG53831.1 transporter [Persicimonas caeni]QED35052.1 transporter [Persicimonas caeni]